MNAMPEKAAGPLSIQLAYRHVPATVGRRPMIAVILEEIGHNVSVVNDGPADISTSDVILMWGNPGYFPGLRRQLQRTERAGRPLVAVAHAEPLPPPKASGLPRWSLLNASEIGKILLRDWRATDIYTNAFKLRRMIDEGTIDLLFVLSAEKHEYATEQGFESWHIPFGYDARFGTMLGLERDVDVLFLGDTRPLRRKWLLNRLRRAGIPVTVRGSWHDDERALWGDERTNFLNRTKIIVHLQRYPGKLASMRFILAMANGAMVVSEPPYRPEPFVDGEHYVSASIHDMPSVIRHYLNHPDERERITSAAYRFVTERLTLTSSMEKMIAIVRERLAGF